MADAWSGEGSRVHLRVPVIGASSIVWVDVYEGPEVTEGNLDSEEIRQAIAASRRAADELAKRWRGMPYEAARAEYDAL